MTEPKKSEIVPFGKYRGQPLEAMAEDKQYADWLVKQPWFREKHGNLYAIVINNFCEPSETPDHNALQARFLDDDFRLQFASVAIPRLWWYGKMNGEMIHQLAANAAVELRKAIIDMKSANDKTKAEFELRMVDFQNRKQDATFSRFIDEPKTPSYVKVVLDCYCENRRRGEAFSGGDMTRVSSPEFEINGVDCCFVVDAGVYCGIRTGRTDGGFWNELWSESAAVSEVLRIEIKPEIGDDYPAILRQMRRNRSYILFTQAYAGLGVDLPTFIRFMDSQKIRVIFESDVDNSEKISVDKFDSKAFMAFVQTKMSNLEA